MRGGLGALKGSNRFRWCLAAIVLGALVIRCGYIATAKREACTMSVGTLVVAVTHSGCLGGPGFVNDQYWYSVTADQVSHGQFFNLGPPTDAPTAAHPPLTVFVLAATSFAFEHLPFSALREKPRLAFGAKFETHVREQRYTMALVGSLVVLLVGLLGRRIGGSRVGLVAALIAAVYPNLWIPDGLLFPEPIARVCVLAALLLALRYRERASAATVLGLGVACGLAALARTELLLLLPALAIPLAWGLRRAGARRMLVVLLAASAGTVVVVGPWVAFNLSRFEDPVFIATNDGITLSGANCNYGYYGPTIGLWAAIGCSATGTEAARLGDESQVSHADRAMAFAYIRAHERRLPVVIAARIARTWGVYRPLDMIGFEVNENKERWASWLGIVTFYPVFLAAIVGAVVLVRRRARFVLWVVCVPLVTTTIVVALTSGQVRHRAVAEPSLCILAAVAVCAISERKTAAT
jgi:4-amino-4-deoxy-L-arabinose transferase-like glycosyltransferase